MIILYKSEMNKSLHLYYKDAGPLLIRSYPGSAILETPT